MPNKTPLFGLSGFGNFMNNYAWSMQVYKNKLYVGTMDWSFLVASSLASILNLDMSSNELMSLDETIPSNFMQNPQDLSKNPYFANLEVDLSKVDLSSLDQFAQIRNNSLIPPLGFGADLWCFESPDAPAKPLSVKGVGNKLNYGIRNMIASDECLFLGMANPMNLSEKGGWELLKISTKDVKADNKLTSVDDNLNPNKFYLANNYPNPFNPSTTIKFNLPEASNVVVEIYNSVGQSIKTLVNEKLSSGEHEVQWNADNMTSGVYFYKIKAGKNLEIKKMTLLK